MAKIAEQNYILHHIVLDSKLIVTLLTS